jgi:hypothetical protein
VEGWFSRISAASRRVWDILVLALCPKWRWMLIILSQYFLYQAMLAVTPGQGHLIHWQALNGLRYSAMCFVCLWLATRPYPPTQLLSLWHKLPAIIRWRGWRAVIVCYMLWLMWHSIYWQVPDVIQGVYRTDAIAFIHLDTDLILHGKNPYTDDAAFWQAVQRWPQAGATPLMGGKTFGNNPVNYPGYDAQEQALLNEYLHPALRNQGDFDPATAHNYPAGILWMELPMVWAGFPSLIPGNLLIYAILVGVLVGFTPKGNRTGALMALITNPIMILYTLFDNFEAPMLLFLVLSWMLIRREKTSGILFGIACALKQLAWFYIPFYLLEVYRREGPMAALRRLGWSALAFLIPNLPFILMSPQAWLHSMFVPMTDPMFPFGFGLITFALSGNLAFGSRGVWTLLELSVFAGLFIFQWRRRHVNSDGMIFGALPLLAAWRSPLNYFAFVPTCCVAVGIQQEKQAEKVATIAPPAIEPAPYENEVAAILRGNGNSKEYAEKGERTPQPVGSKLYDILQETPRSRPPRPIVASEQVPAPPGPH